MKEIMKKNGEVSIEQIEAWKRAHRDVYVVEVGDSVCYLKQPERAVLSLAIRQGGTDPMMYNEVILTNCWLGGNEAIKTDDSMFLGVGAVISELIEIKQATIKKA